MTDRETRRLSFGSVAEDYDRYRPPPPPQALDWLIPDGVSGTEAILDLAAGTGIVTRELIGRARRVVAVEPDERMRAVLAARCPQAEVLAGRGEDIPLPDASVDAVVISAAWHWLDPALAVPEITRVLRPGGRLGVIWVSRDDRVPWVAEFNAFARESREADRPEGQHGGRSRGPAQAPPGRVPAGHAAVGARGAAGGILGADDPGSSWRACSAPTAGSSRWSRASGPSSPGGSGRSSTASRGTRPTCR